MWKSILKTLKAVVSVTLVAGLLGCAGTSEKKESTAPETNYFGPAEGCFLLYNMTTDKFEKVIGDERCRQQLPACSTFKVPLAVMAFDSGVLKDENVTLKWDGVVDTRAESNRDHTAKTWMNQSIVWFSQKLTPKFGKRKFQKYLNDFEYGNRDLKGGIQNAWLVSPASTGPALKISAYEQVEFMKKLWTDKLPVSKRSMKLTRDLTYLETSDRGTALHGKTGSNFYDKDRKIHLGWFISHIQHKDQSYIAVTSFNDRSATETASYGGPRAKEITKKILADLGLW